MVGESFQRRTVGVLALGHAVNDAYGGFLSPLLPLLIAKFDISLLKKPGFWPAADKQPV